MVQVQTNLLFGPRAYLMTLNPNCRVGIFSHPMHKAPPEGNNRKHPTRPAGANQIPHTIIFGMDYQSPTKRSIRGEFLIREGVSGRVLGWGHL